MSLMFCGIGVSRGIAIGGATIYRRNSIEVTKKEITKKTIPAEVRRFKQALNIAKKHLSSVRDGIPDSAPSDVSAFIETHLLMLDDSVLSQRPIELIKQESISAESALQIQREELSAVFLEMEDPYIATRMDDVNHVIDEIMRAFNADEKSPDQSQHWRGQVVIADDLTPADTLVMQSQGVAGFVTETGGQLSHTAILARSLGIPAIVGVHNIRRYITTGENVILDGDTGTLLAEPESSMITDFRRRQKKNRQRLKDLDILVDQETLTRDGTAYTLQANIEVQDDIKALRRVQAEGVGLYRTEFLYMNQEELPTEDEHYKLYSRVLRSLKGAPLTIRTVDLGADKQLEKATRPLAHNPAMGLRGIRLCLSDTSLILPQLRAILRASAKGPINIMFPMLTNVQEIKQCLELIESVKATLSEKKQKYDHNIKIGGMIEVPGAAMAADQFARHLDFLSIGTNDLIQYTLAIDRIDDQVDYLYDPLHPAVLRLIKKTIDAGTTARIPVGMCGEMAGDPRYVRLLLGLGLTQFSMPTNQVLEVKRVLNTADRKKLKKLALAVIECDTREEQQKLLDKINAGTSAVLH